MSGDTAVGAAFKEAYASLNAAQKQAVDTIDGPVMVIAGPGTGKTQILTLRIAKILLETDMQPENILALTFTEAGVKAMRDRLRRYVGSAAYRVSIFTFHGFSQRLIRDYPDAYQKVIGGRAASDLDKISLVESILEDTSFKLLRPIGNPLYHVPAITRTLSTLKQEYVTLDRLADIIATQETDLQNTEKIHQKGAHKGKVRGEYTTKEKAITKNKELLSLYRQYETLLVAERLYDFEDMIIETVTALEKNEDMLRDLQETYQYVLADEHQDVNGSQNKILELLSNFHDQPNIFVVGDEKQAIYRFQGASLDNFLYFTHLFKNTTEISLTENYRSGQTVLDAAHSLVAVESGPLKNLRIPLEAAAVAEAVIEKRSFAHQAIEDEWLVAEVQAALDRGTAPEEIAVIVRTNREVEQFAALLRKAGVAIEASADADILEHPITHTVISLIEAVVGGQNEAALFALLHGAYWGLSASDVVTIARARSYQLSLSDILSDEQKLQDLGVVGVVEAGNIIQTLEAAREQSVSEPPHRVLEFLLNQSGFLKHISKYDPLESGRVVRRLYDEVEKMVIHDNKSTLREVHELLQNYRVHRVSLTAPFVATSDTAVQVLTAHKSKGLEFSVVFVPHLVDRVWGGGRKRTDFKIPTTQFVDTDEFDVLDDERRLLYVAMTRAKQVLYLSYSEQNQEGRELTVSRLLADIEEALMRECDTASQESSFNAIGSLQSKDRGVVIGASFLTTHLAERGLSATALNNYLASPYDYLYRNVLRVPEVQTLPLQFGTAMHGVLEWVSGVVATKKQMPSTTELAAQLEVQLARLPISTNEFTRLHEDGLAALTVYLEHSKQSMLQPAKVEFAAHVMLETGIPELPQLPLTGKLDRLELDEAGNVVRVIDYKTGKPKTRNDIEGKTKTSNGNYKRQLVFYALLLSLLDDERYACRTGLLSFVQPDSKGVIKEEEFGITDEEIAELKAEIIAVTKEIITGSFLAEPCDPEQSSYCDLAARLGELGGEGE